MRSAELRGLAARDLRRPLANARHLRLFVRGKGGSEREVSVTERSTGDEFVLRRQLDQMLGYDVVLVDCPPSLGVNTINALTAASRLIVVTEPSFLALHGSEELLKTSELVRAHYNPGLALGGVIVNRVEPTVEHRLGLAEIAGFFDPALVWRPYLPKRTALQAAARSAVPMDALRTRAARELADDFAALARRIEVRDGA